MKLKYPVIGLVILLISANVWQSIIGSEAFATVGQPIFDTLLLILLGLIAYLVAKLLFNEIGDLMGDIQRTSIHRELHREQQASQVEQINQELDEIEASLNTVVLNKKVTPIWEISTKKP